MSEDESAANNKELYALLHVSPEASEEEIRKAYRQFAQVYHPDKYQPPHMKEIATANFQRICEAYEILTDERKRVIYDIYGMEGLTSGLEVGPTLSKAHELREELDRLKRAREEMKKKLSGNNFRPSATVVASASIPHMGLRGMGMRSHVESRISKTDTLAVAANVEVNGGAGGASATAVLRRQVSPATSVEVAASAGLQALLAVQSSRHLTVHSTATVALAVSLRDGSLNLTNTWTRQLSDDSSGNIQLGLGPESSISAGWQKKSETMSASGEVKFGTASFGASTQYTHRFSSKSHGRVAARIGSTNIELEVGGGRKLSNFSTVRMLYAVGIQGIFWKFELHRGGQKLIIPILLTRHLSPTFATGAFVIPTSLYFIMKKFVLKPYYRKREKQKALESKEKSFEEVGEAKAAAEKAQQLLQIVANRKKRKQSEMNGLVITRALYGSHQALTKIKENRDEESESHQFIDVTLPLNFLVNESGHLKLHEGVKKSGIMGFCDPCPGESKHLYVEYTYGNNRYEVMIDDYAELVIPEDGHKI